MVARVVTVSMLRLAAIRGPASAGSSACMRLLFTPRSRTFSWISEIDDARRGFGEVNPAEQQTPFAPSPLVGEGCRVWQTAQQTRPIPPLEGEVDRRSEARRSGGVDRKWVRSLRCQPPPGSLCEPTSPASGGGIIEFAARRIQMRLPHKGEGSTAVRGA